VRTKELTHGKKCFPSKQYFFSTITDAKAHFNDLRESTQIGATISEPERSSLLDLYKRYCVATNFQAEDAVDVTTAWDNKQRSNETYAPTKSFAIITSSNLIITFSIDKAIRSVAIDRR
tara:strand:- start:214 stop:570 length:357 start_codon:yes stop_codon:yes gene_type:complete